MLNYSLAIQQSLVHNCSLNGKRKLAAKCTVRSSSVCAEAERSLPGMFCARSIPVPAIAALYRPHSARPALRFRAGVPPPCEAPPVQPWGGGTMKYKQPPPAACSSARQGTRAGLQPGEGGVSGSQEGSCAGAALSTAGEQKACRCRFALRLLLSKSLQDRVKPFYLPFLDQLKCKVLQSWAEKPPSLKPLC